MNGLPATLRSILRLGALTLALSTPASAQGRCEIVPGSPVRFTAGGETVLAQFVHAAGDTLVAREGGTERRFPLGTLGDLETRCPEVRGTSGGAIAGGALLGGILGGLLGHLSADLGCIMKEGCAPSTGDVVKGGLAGAFLGGALGAALGGAHRGSGGEWVPATLSVTPGLGPQSPWTVAARIPAGR